MNKLIYFFNQQSIFDFNEFLDFGKIDLNTTVVDFVNKKISYNDNDTSYKEDIFGNIDNSFSDYTKETTDYLLKIVGIFDDDCDIRKMLNLKNEVKYNEIFLPEIDDDRELKINFTKREFIKDFLNENNITYDGNCNLIKKISVYKNGNYKFEFFKYEKNLYELKSHNEYTNIIHWKNMPQHGDNFRLKYEHSIVYDMVDFSEDEIRKFKSKYDLSNGSIVYPKIEDKDVLDIRCIGGRNPKFPIYVVSKGRWDLKDNTSYHLSNMGVKHYLIAEPQEVELYKKNMNAKYCTVIPLDMSYKDKYDLFDEKLGKGNGTGPGPARNFAIDHSKTLNSGTNWLLVCDDNLDAGGCKILTYGRRLKCLSGEMFAVCEDFLDRYDNIGLAGYNYVSFVKDSVPNSTFTLNTRIYSFVLMRNDLKESYQRGRYNEDTDQSLRILKKGLCTVQFNMFLFSKTRTQRIKNGGNSEEFYNNEGTYNKSLMLKEMHSDVVECVKKFGRWHHSVNYSVFKQKLHFKDDYVEKKYDEPFRYIKIPTEWRNTEKDCIDYINSHLDECVEVDMKKEYGYEYKDDSLFDL